MTRHARARLVPGVFLLAILLAVSAGLSPPDKIPENISRQFNQALAAGESRWKEGDFGAASAWLLEALEYAQKSNAVKDEIICLKRLARLSWALGRPEDSQTYYHQVQTKATQINSPTDIEEARSGLKIWELYSQAKDDRNAGLQGKSIQKLEEAVGEARKLGSPEHQVKCFRQLSLAYWSSGDREKSLELSRAGLDMARALRDQREQAKCLINFGLYYFTKQDYNRALDYYSEAKDLSREVKNKTDEMACLKSIAVILMNLGFFEQAVDQLQAAYDIDSQSLFGGLLPLNLNNLGEALRNRGLIFSAKVDLSRAVDCFSEAFDLARKEGDLRTELVAYNNLGNTHLDLGNYHTALHYIETAGQLARQVQDRDAAIRILNNMGICRFKMGDAEEARKCFEQVLEQADQSLLAASLWETLLYLGEYHEKRNAYAQALDFYRRSLDAIDYVRSRIRADDYKTRFLSDKIRAYEALVSLLLKKASASPEQQIMDEVFQVIERAKARAFLEILAGIKEAPPGGPESPLRKEERELSRQIASLIRQMSRNILASQQRVELDAELRRAEDEYVRLVSRMREEDPEFSTPDLPMPLQASQVQDRLLDDKTAILEYHLGEGQSLLFLITRKECRLVRLPPKIEIESSLYAYVKLLSDPPQGEWRGLAAGARLAKILFSGTLTGLPDSIEHLVIIPDGRLWALPFETLPFRPRASAADDFLISRYAVSYAASCSSLLFLKEKRTAGPVAKSLLAFGDPIYTRRLPAPGKGQLSAARVMKDIYKTQGFELYSLGQSQAEIEKIARFFPKGRTDIYLREAATEENVKKAALQHYEIVHFACHAFQDEDVPFRSGLFLSLGKGQEEDGFLHAREIAGLRFPSELVVLSACRSSRGYVENGEGAMGLTRTFFSAGARSVVSSLWEVSDRAAAEFMRLFYDHLCRGENKAQALRSAKRGMLGTTYSHPFYWAAFILQGEASSRIRFD